MNFKEIHIGILINQAVTERGVETPRICNFLKCTEEELEEMYLAKSLDADILLRWSKLLEYDFFRLYSQHLILYAPKGNMSYNTIKESSKSSLPQFRKNIYTKEVIDFVMELVEKEEKTRAEIIEQYGIPKTTLYKWISKYRNLNNI